MKTIEEPRMQATSVSRWARASGTAGRLGLG
jgi:hypothetical protein